MPHIFFNLSFLQQQNSVIIVCPAGRQPTTITYPEFSATAALLINRYADGQRDKVLSRFFFIYKLQLSVQMTYPHQFLPVKTSCVACPSTLSFIVVLCKHLIQSHILRGALLNEGPVLGQNNIPDSLTNKVSCTDYEIAILGVNPA